MTHTAPAADRVTEAQAQVARLEAAYRAAVAEGFRCEIDRLFVALQNARRELRCRQLFA